MLARASSTIAAALIAAALLSGCGGSDAPRARSAEQAFADATRQTPPQSDRLRALSSNRGEGGTAAAATVTVTAAQLFQAIAILFPDLFPGTPVTLSLQGDGVTFDIRFYSATGNYVAVGSNGMVYALGGFTGNVVVVVGPLQDLSGTVCTSVTCSTGGTTGSLNGCTMPAHQALVAGNRFHATFVSTAPGMASGQYTVDAVVDGPSTFNGQSAIRTTTRMVGTQMGYSVDTTSRTYEQVIDGGLFRRLGIDVQMATPMAPLSTTVYTPPDDSTEFTLQLGGSIPKPLTATTTTAGTSGSYTQSTTTTHKYEARETITVPAGTFETCRYRQTVTGSSSYTLQWFIVGKGLGVRVEGRSGDGTLAGRAEMTSGTFNGAPL